MKKKKKSSKFCYIELSVSDFFSSYPDVALDFSPCEILEYLSNPDYVVRFSLTSGEIEIGFPSDNWVVFN